MMKTDDAKVIGVGGFARSGKDTFVKVASKILESNGYRATRVAFADALKDDIDDWLMSKYDISAWTDDLEEKKIIRPFLVAHGCGKRMQTEGRYWIDKINSKINEHKWNDELNKIQRVFLVSDVRFPNEANWVHDKWNGWVIHLKKYRWCYETVSMFDDGTVEQSGPLHKVYDVAPNSEEAENDPKVEAIADFNLELENVIEYENKRGNKITVENIADSSYLQEQVTKCLKNCPFLHLKTP